VTARPRILLGFTGSVASVKIPELVGLLSAFSEVRTVGTAKGCFFTNYAPSETEETEWSFRKLGDPVHHIELRRWADLFLIAPLSANTLAKVAGGHCDNLLTSVARAWDFSKPLLVAPAMNTAMWNHPATAEQVQRLLSWQIRVIEPESRQLACMDIGMGALASLPVIVHTVHDSLKLVP